MNKILNYLRHGKGRGLLIALITSLLFSAAIYWEAATMINGIKAQPGVTEFINEFPELTVENGVIKEDVIWARPVPIIGYPIVVNTSVDKVNLPQNPGFYLTRRAFTTVQGGRAAMWEFLPTFNMNFSLAHVVAMIAPAVAAIAFIVLWIGYFLSVLLTMLLAWLARVPRKDHRVWRTVTVTYLGLGILNVLITLITRVGIGFYPWIGATVILATIVLYLIRGEKEI